MAKTQAVQNLEDANRLTFHCYAERTPKLSEFVQELARLLAGTKRKTVSWDNVFDFCEKHLNGTDEFKVIGKSRRCAYVDLLDVLYAELQQNQRDLDRKRAAKATGELLPGKYYSRSQLAKFKAAQSA